MLPAIKPIRVLTILILLVIQKHGMAQDRCGTEKYLQLLQTKGFETNRRFEEWVEQRTRVRSKGTQETGRTEAAKYRIPVVVHVIHNGENHATNIPDAQILSQLKVLNEDYNRKNADATNTPAVFTSVAGALEIEFVLAKRTPEGLPTTGIVRMQGPKNEWRVSDNYQLKSLSYWPSEDYLNIWVCNLTDYLGYAQFPQTTLLDGLENSSTNSLTDGVVITYNAFGSIADGNFNLQQKYNKGRTATHEIGHYFGLRHIWGDDQGNCGGSGDYVGDTPDQSDRTYNCPSHPRTTCNSIVSMFQNFLDYTNDACMNLFTNGQVSRMSVIIENSPRRKSLLTSPGLLDPSPVANDLGIRGVHAPEFGECPGPVVPAIEVRNYGTNTVSSAEIVLKKGNVTIETKQVALSLDPLEAAIVSFSSVSLSAGSHEYSFEVTSTNGGADGNTGNNRIKRFVFVPQNIETSFIETLQQNASKWNIINPDNLTTWEYADAINESPGNRALKMNFYDYEDNEGEVDIFLSPVIDLTNVPVALLLFDVAHAQYQESNDGLKVVVLRDCNNDINLGEVLYSKSGRELASADRTTEAFEPSSAADWRTESINLSQYIGQSRIQLAFVGVNDWGNNVYLDNIKVLTEDFANLTLKNIVAPAPIVCGTSIPPVLRIVNSGTNVNSFVVSYAVNGETKTHLISNIDFPSGTEMNFSLPELTLKPGSNDLVFSVLNPDGNADLDPTDNTQGLTVISSRIEGRVPYRETFETDFSSRWTILSPKGNPTWRSEALNTSTALVYEGFKNTIAGDEAWLVSPVFSLENVDEASLHFDVSYAIRNNISELLQIRVAKGCDASFDHVLGSFTGNDLTELTTNSTWSPSSLNDWSSKKVSMSNYIGESDLRVAFVVTNKRGNNIFLDNIQLYLSEEPFPVKVEGAFNVFPNPSFVGDDVFIRFNLPELSNIQLDITDSKGKIVRSHRYTDILNQTLSLGFDETTGGYGLYIIRVTTPHHVYYSKFIHSR